MGLLSLRKRTPQNLLQSYCTHPTRELVSVCVCVCGGGGGGGGGGGDVYV